MSLVFIGLGSNLGDGRANLRSAWRRLGGQAGITALALSSPYLSEPVGMESAHWFTNAVGIIETSVAPEELLGILLRIETAMGRDRRRGTDRSIDLDILYYDDLVVSSATLELPHPELHRRLFVLLPMLELAPDHLHPVREQTTSHMWRKMTDSRGQRIKKLTWQAA